MRTNSCKFCFLLAASALTTTNSFQTSTLSTRRQSQVYTTPREKFLSHDKQQQRRRQIYSANSSQLASSTIGDDDLEERQTTTTTTTPMMDEKSSNQATNDNVSGTMKKLIDGLPFVQLFKPDGYKKLPPMHVEDMNLLLYDIFLIVNLTLSISFWVTHRMSFEYLPAAFNEGSLLSILWIVSGLYHGTFLASAVDGHYRSTDEESGPKAAAILALNTFVNAVNLRLLFALATAVIQHRQVGMDPGEQLLPLEIGFGLALMTCWRALHSSITPRI